MKITSYAKNQHDLSLAKEAGLNEVILGCYELNRFSKESIDQLNKNLSQAKNLGLKTILEWDILISENDFEVKIDQFKEIHLEDVDAIRVQDAGVLEFCLEQTNLPLQFIAETGNHNITGLKKWEDYIGDRLERIILSSELNNKLLTEYKEKLNCDLEILAVGRILLFYSPRKLLNHLLPEDDEYRMKSLTGEDFIEALGESEESPHKGFPVIENKHGTFMFHIKDLFLLDKKEELKNTNIDFCRIDLRFETDNSFLMKVHNKFETNYLPDELKSDYGKDIIRGYFQVNKSDVLFKKLKNYRIQRKDESYIGEVTEIAKSDYMAITIKGKVKLKVDDQIKLITPEGKEIFTKVFFVKNSNYEDISERTFNELALVNYVGGVWPKSQVYFDLPSINS